MTEGWIGVDLDGTLAHYESGQFPVIGDPIPRMMNRVRGWLAKGKTVKIFTARACEPEGIPPVKAWLQKVGLPDLEVTNAKDYNMVEFWDDRAISVIPNTGMVR